MSFSLPTPEDEYVSNMSRIADIMTALCEKVIFAYAIEKFGRI